jgi:hypothetical protein
MERCAQCNATLKSEEKECWGCGSVVPEKNPKKTIYDRFRTVVNVLFIVFAVLTPASLFLPSTYVPSFFKCFAGLMILFLVRSSVRNMGDAKSQ